MLFEHIFYYSNENTTEIEVSMKPTYINIDEGMLLAYHEELMNELYLLYHVHPTNLPHISLSNNELAEMAEYDALGQDLTEQCSGGQKYNTKKVRFFKKPYYSNGLPRR
jgi:hypothetical protein